MFGSKSPATFFVKLFDKEEKTGDDCGSEDVGEDVSPSTAPPNRKRSQSMFAPNVTSLWSGEHVGGGGND